MLDVSRVLAGPFCTMLLADLGADVVKVEPPEGDATRRWGPPFTADGTAAYYLAINRNRRSLRLDLHDSADAELLRRLAAAADVVVHNHLPATAAALGLDEPAIRAVNPRCVIAAVSAFGPEQPERRGFDLVMQAVGGMMAVTGPAGGPPVKAGVAVADLAAGLYTAVGILAGLVRRERGGGATTIEVALIDATVSLLINQAMNWLVAGFDPPRMGSDHPNLVPYAAYATAAGDMVVGVGSDGQFAALCAVLGRPDLAADPRFRHNQDRVAHRDAMRSELERALRTRPAAEWEPLLASAGVPAARIRGVAEVLQDPALGGASVVEVEGVPQLRSPIRVDGVRPLPYAAPPSLGQDTDAVRRAAAASEGRAASGDGEPGSH